MGLALPSFTAHWHAAHAACLHLAVAALMCAACRVIFCRLLHPFLHLPKVLVAELNYLGVKLGCGPTSGVGLSYVSLSFVPIPPIKKK